MESKEIIESIYIERKTIITTGKSENNKDEEKKNSAWKSIFKKIMYFWSLWK